jgi:ataxin-3
MELAYMSQNDEGGINSKDYIKRLAEGSGNVDESGNFSIEVLRSALMTRHGLELPNIRQQGVNHMEVTQMEGFICNRSSHWFAIRKINGRFWNLNSTNERPELISHFNLAREMEELQNAGYSVFCVVERLPPPCSCEAMMDQGLVSYYFRSLDLCVVSRVLLLVYCC